MADAEAICEAVTIALPVTAMRGRMTLNSVNLEGFCRAWAKQGRVPDEREEDEAR